MKRRLKKYYKQSLTDAMIARHFNMCEANITDQPMTLSECKDEAKELVAQVKLAVQLIDMLNHNRNNIAKEDIGKVNKEIAYHKWIITYCRVRIRVLMDLLLREVKDHSYVLPVH